MAEKDYEYRGLLAASWDLLRGDTSNWSDRAFYRELIQVYGQPALDVGCGTGRLLLDYFSSGIDIDGVDVSPEMLDLCRKKAARSHLQPGLYQQNMGALSLPRRYRTILVPSSSFQLLIDLSEARQALKRLYDHLEPGGVLVMSIMVLWKEGKPLEDSDWRIAGLRTRLEDGKVIRRWSKSRFDPKTSLEHTEDRFEVLQEGHVLSSEYHQRSPATRSYTQAEITGLYEQAGFSEVRLMKGFTLEPASPEDDLFCIIGMRPVN